MWKVGGGVLSLPVGGFQLKLKGTVLDGFLPVWRVRNEPYDDWTVQKYAVDKLEDPQPQYCASICLIAASKQRLDWHYVLRVGMRECG